MRQTTVANRLQRLPTIVGRITDLWMGNDVRGEKQIAEISEILILWIDIRKDYVKNTIKITQLTKYHVIRLKECFDGVYDFQD